MKVTVTKAAGEWFEVVANDIEDNLPRRVRAEISRAIDFKDSHITVSIPIEAEFVRVVEQLVDGTVVV